MAGLSMPETRVPSSVKAVVGFHGAFCGMGLAAARVASSP
jgi:hypothetical protein